MRHLIRQENTKQFILAGNATFTAQGQETRFTFKVTKADGNGPVSHFVKVLVGPNNSDDFVYLGHIYKNGSYTHGRKSRIGKEAQSAKAFNWIWGHIDNLPESVEIFHEGRCGRCGRKLTVPQSIIDGYGPDCVQKV